jgi:hypothetical protein
VSALEIEHIKGNGGGPQNCQEPMPSGRTCLGSASVKLSILGYPWERVCRKHAREAQKIWDEAAGVVDEIEAAA